MAEMVSGGVGVVVGQGPGRLHLRERLALLDQRAHALGQRRVAQGVERLRERVHQRRRRARYGERLQQAVKIGARVLWMQLGVISPEAARQAEARRSQ